MTGRDAIKNWRYFSFTIAAAAAALAAACSCSQEKAQSVTRSTKVQLKIHAWEGYAREHEADFKKLVKETKNIDLDIVITNTSGYDSFVDAIKNAGVHLVSPANDLVRPLKKLGLIRPVDTSRIKNFNQINPLLMKTRSTEVGGVICAVPFNIGAYWLVYNKDKVPTPSSYEILWDPRFRKRVTISGVYDTINIYITALLLGFPKQDLFHLSDEQLKRIEEKLRILNTEQISDFWAENLNPAKRDQFDIGMDWGVGVQQINHNYGGNWGVVIPKEGVTAWMDTWAVTTNVKDDITEDIAYRYIEYMISPAVQAKMAKLTSYGPANPYATRYFSAAEKKMYFLTDPKLMSEFIIWQPLDDRTMERYRQTWQRSRK
jgi:spermidine/putrescine-binding protein